MNVHGIINLGMLWKKRNQYEYKYYTFILTWTQLDSCLLPVRYLSHRFYSNMEIGKDYMLDDYLGKTSTFPHKHHENVYVVNLLMGI